MPRSASAPCGPSSTRTASAAAASCSIRKLVLVEPRPYRAFQGWRYLAAKDAPRDLDKAATGAAAMPEKLRRELRELGLM